MMFQTYSMVLDGPEITGKRVLGTSSVLPLLFDLDTGDDPVFDSNVRR